MKTLTQESKKYIESIGKYLKIEKYSDGSKFYCLLDKYGNFNIADTGRSYEEICERIQQWEKLISNNVVKISR